MRLSDLERVLAMVREAEGDRELCLPDADFTAVEVEVRMAEEGFIQGARQLAYLNFIPTARFTEWGLQAIRGLETLRQMPEGG